MGHSTPRRLLYLRASYWVRDVLGCLKQCGGDPHAPARQGALIYSHTDFDLPSFTLQAPAVNGNILVLFFFASSRTAINT